jgi:WS/DGAT/MGAT family acyltransferase
MDASFLFAEDGRSHMDIGMVLVFDGPPPSRDEVAAAVTARLPLVPRYRQKVRLVPFNAGLPVWVDDPAFHIDRHLFTMHAPADGGPHTLARAVSERMSGQLDQSKPLWEMHLITGLPDDRWSLLTRMHHGMVDGVSSTEIVKVLLTDEPEPPPPMPDYWQPRAEPSDAELVREAVADGVGAVTQAVRQWMDTVTRPAPPPPDLVPAYDLQPVTAGMPVTDPTLNGPIGPGRRWDVTEFTLADVKRIRRAAGGTVNDVMLTLCARGFRDLLRHRGEPVEGRVVRSMVPVALRGAAAGRTAGNEIAAMMVELPVGDLSEVDRLRAVHRQTAAFKRLQDAMPAADMASAAAFVPPAMVAMGSRLAGMLPAYAQTVTSNVPGPQAPKYFCGRQMIQLSACIALWAPLRIAVVVLSYLGTLTFGVVADRDSVPDADVLMKGAESSMAELLAASRGMA